MSFQCILNLISEFELLKRKAFDNQCPFLIISDNINGTNFPAQDVHLDNQCLISDAEGQNI